jgi:uncharacterized membrane protein
MDLHVQAIIWVTTGIGAAVLSAIAAYMMGVGQGERSRPNLSVGGLMAFLALAAGVVSAVYLIIWIIDVSKQIEKI